MSLTAITTGLLKDRNVIGRIVFAMQAGSGAYNLTKPTSDKDIFAVYSASPTSFWGLHMPPENLNGKGSLEGVDADIKITEIGMQVLWIADFRNPAIIEALYATHNSESSPVWESLKSNRKAFLSNDLVKQYISFAKGQIEQIKSKPENNKKKIYNATRLLMEARRMLQGNEPRVWLEGEDREYLMEIRNEKHDLQTLITQAQTNIDDLFSKKPWKLLEKVDEGWINNWLVEHRKAMNV